MQKIFVRLSVVVLIFAIGTSANAQKRAITEKDLFDFAWVGDPQISPDGATVAFVKVTVNAAKTNYDTSIWAVSTSGSEEPRRMTSGNRDATPRWSPDGKFLAFVRSPETPGPAAAPQLYMLSMAGGDSWAFTSLPRGAGGPIWSPDGKWIAFGNTATADELPRQGRPAPPPADGRETDVRVITRAVYRADGGGYIDTNHPNHLWVIAAPKSPEEKPLPKQLTSGAYNEGGFVWSRDGSQIYYTTNRTFEPYYDEKPNTEIYSVPSSGGTPTLLTKIEMGVGGLSLSPDGSKFAFNASASAKPVLSYTQPDLWVMDIAPNAQPKNLTTGFDYDIGGGVGGDNCSAAGRRWRRADLDGRRQVDHRAVRERGSLESRNVRCRKRQNDRRDKGRSGSSELSFDARCGQNRLHEINADCHYRSVCS